jgi:hypothetical protein
VFEDGNRWVRRYNLGVKLLLAAQPHIVPAAGGSWREMRPHDIGAVLAARLGVKMAEFSGFHTGYVLRPKTFAGKRREV